MVFNTFTAHMSVVDNSHETRSRYAQQQSTANMWVGIVTDNFSRQDILSPEIDARKYLDFLQDVITEMRTMHASHVRRRMWFQHDGARSHYLNWIFRINWIGRGGTIPGSLPMLRLYDPWYARKHWKSSQSMSSVFHACIHTKRRNFEYLLWYL